MVRNIADRQYRLHDQEPAARSDRFPAVAQDRDALPVIPVVQNVREDVSLVAGGDRFKKITLNHLAARDQSGILKTLPRNRRCRGLLEQDAALSLVCAQYDLEQTSCAAAEIDDDGKS